MPSEHTDNDRGLRGVGHRSDGNIGRTMLGEDIALDVKIVVAGGAGAGKTTLVGSVSEIRPLYCEEADEVGLGVTAGGAACGEVEGQAGEMGREPTTTVAMDFGRITVHTGLSLHLFGMPGRERFRFLWEELSTGALAAIVLTDPGRLEGCVPAVDHFERARIPFVVAVNRFCDSPGLPERDVARSLGLDAGVPVVLCDARHRESGKDVLIRTVEYAGRVHAARLLASVG
ncbi:ATP/GTP-binding protein [Streptomyces californicus]|uniref:GTP-binding protein n=1 Tax=Streptomyces californicus TaxID=67351 RepID=UPI0036DA6D75